MSYVEKHDVVPVTATGGGVTAYTPVVTGRVSAIIYTKAGTNPYDAGSDVTITTEDSGQNLWTEVNVNASESNYPVVAASLPNGTASTITETPIYAAGERVKIVIAQGGNTKTGTFTVIIA